MLVDELHQQYTYLGEARFAIPVKRFAILLWGGAGLWQVGSNLLQVADVLPADHLRVEITPTGPTARRFALTATGPRHERLLADLSPQPGGPPAE